MDSGEYINHLCLRASAQLKKSYRSTQRNQTKKCLRRPTRKKEPCSPYLRALARPSFEVPQRGSIFHHSPCRLLERNPVDFWGQKMSLISTDDFNHNNWVSSQWMDQIATSDSNSNAFGPAVCKQGKRGPWSVPMERVHPQTRPLQNALKGGWDRTRTRWRWFGEWGDTEQGPRGV